MARGGRRAHRAQRRWMRRSLLFANWGAALSRMAFVTHHAQPVMRTEVREDGRVWVMGGPSVIFHRTPAGVGIVGGFDV